MTTKANLASLGSTWNVVAAATLVIPVAANYAWRPSDGALGLLLLTAMVVGLGLLIQGQARISDRIGTIDLVRSLEAAKDIPEFALLLQHIAANDNIRENGIVRRSVREVLASALAKVRTATSGATPTHSIANCIETLEGSHTIVSRTSPVFWLGDGSPQTTSANSRLLDAQLRNCEIHSIRLFECTEIDLRRPEVRADLAKHIGGSAAHYQARIKLVEAYDTKRDVIIIARGKPPRIGEITAAASAKLYGQEAGSAKLISNNLDERPKDKRQDMEQILNEFEDAIPVVDLLAKFEQASE